MSGLTGTLLVAGAVGLAVAGYVAACSAQSARLARAETQRMMADALASFGRIVASLNEHLYTAELLPDGRYRPLYTGPGLARLLGGQPPPGSHPTRVFFAAVHPEDRDAIARLFEEVRAGRPAECEYRVAGLDGVVRRMQERARPRPDAGGRVVFDGIVTDVTEMRRADDELRAALEAARTANGQLELARLEAERLSSVDPLTGLFNRRHFGAELDEALRAASPERTPGLLMLDLDHFKRINDTTGHHAGDAVLVATARRLAGALPASACLGRFGGEEFCVLVPAVADDEELRALGERLRAAVASEPIALAGRQPQRVTVSVGAARHDGRTRSPEPLLRQADGALYAAKRRGRNRVCLHADVRAEARQAHDREAA